MTTKMIWRGGIDGILLVNEPIIVSINNVSEVAYYTRKNYALLSDKLLETLGAVSLFMSIREYGSGSQGYVLDRADRALDSFYMVSSNQEKNKYIDRGIETIKNHLYSIRNESYEIVKQEAWEFLMKNYGQKTDANEFTFS